jgi:hypothetical protein
VTSRYTNQIRYKWNQHEVRLTFFDQRQKFEGPYAQPTSEEAEEVCEVVMTRQTFRAYLNILNEAARAMTPIGVPDPADREQAVPTESEL